MGGSTNGGSAALSAAKQWSFVPAKQGDVAQDGWVSVPIDFKIH
ncbi:energy transducer TonB family protein [Pseudomonas sp. EA_5y_Pfl2_R50]